MQRCNQSLWKGNKKSNRKESREEWKTAKLDRNPGVTGNSGEPYSNDQWLQQRSSRPLLTARLLVVQVGSSGRTNSKFVNDNRFHIFFVCPVVGRYPIQEEQIFEFRQAKRAGPVATRKIQKQRKSSSKIVAINNNNNNNNNDNKKIYKINKTKIKTKQ